MSRKPTPETELKTVKRELRQSQEDAAKWLRDANTYRARAMQAEQECADWRKRFDLLLARTPAKPEVSHD
jgi:hypothetical protein